MFQKPISVARFGSILILPEPVCLFLCDPGREIESTEHVQYSTVPASVFVSGLAIWVSCLLSLKEIELIIELQESKRVKPSLWDSQQIGSALCNCHENL